MRISSLQGLARAGQSSCKDLQMVSPSGGEENFLYPHFCATCGIFRQAQTHLMEAWGRTWDAGWLDSLSVRCL